MVLSGYGIKGDITKGNEFSPPVNMPLVASTGPVLAGNGMFTDNVQLLTVRAGCTLPPASVYIRVVKRTPVIVLVFVFCLLAGAVAVAIVDEWKHTQACILVRIRPVHLGCRAGICMS